MVIRWRFERGVKQVGPPSHRPGGRGPHTTLDTRSGEKVAAHSAIDRRAQGIPRPATSAAQTRETDERGAIDYKLSWM